MKVILLFSKNVTDPTGASAVMHYLKESKPLFAEKGILFSCLTRDDLNLNKNINVISNAKRGLSRIKGLLVKYIENRCKVNPLFAILHNYIRSGRAGKLLIDTYLSKKHNDDIVFLHEIDVCYYYLKKRSVRDGAKVVLVSHNDGELYSALQIDYPCLKRGFFKDYLKKKERYVLSNIDRLGFVSESSMNNFKRNNTDFPKEKLFYCLNGISDIKKIVRCPLNSSQYRVCCVGTLSIRKGQLFLIEAMIGLPLAILNRIHIDIIGDGPIMQELQDICKANRLESYVTFWGKRKDIPSLLAKNNIFILPSLNEGLPIAIMEAMRQMLPIVSTKVGGIPEMIEENVNGVFIEPSTEGVKKFFLSLDSYNWDLMGFNSRQLYERKFGTT